jgi:hypothetical protein
VEVTDLEGPEPVGVSEFNIICFTDKLSDGLVELNNHSVVLREDRHEVRHDVLLVGDEFLSSMREGELDRLRGIGPGDNPVTRRSDCLGGLGDPVP